MWAAAYAQTSSLIGVNKGRIPNFLSEQFIVIKQGRRHKVSSNRAGNIKEIVAEAIRKRQEREKGYRERALKLFPKICARCGREFSGKRLRELTVHHKDHNHNYNPPDGSNWELLCVYCHENEHARDQVADAYATEPGGESPTNHFGHNPFAGLSDLLNSKKKQDE
jgi:hypothetical protein